MAQLSLSSHQKMTEADIVAAICDALSSKFGDFAEDVARRQIEAATGASLKTWLNVVSRLSDASTDLQTRDRNHQNQPSRR
jgi:hypothetical protein